MRFESESDYRVFFKFFFYWRAPQQMLRTHRSLKACCATLLWRWFFFFFIFPSNGAPMEWNWQGKTEVLGENPVPVPLCQPQIPHGLTRDRTRASAVRDRRLTAWAMAQPSRVFTETLRRFRRRPHEHQDSSDKRSRPVHKSLPLATHNHSPVSTTYLHRAEPSRSRQ
jgi:hypothetical protein